MSSGHQIRRWRCLLSWQARVTLLAALGALACAPARDFVSFPQGLRVVTAPAPSASERYCAWYGARAGDVLYFGEAPFWSALHASGGDARGDVANSGPQRVGRFDLRREEMLPALEVGPKDARSGTWDVLVVEGRLYYTTFFEHSGFVDLASGKVTRLPQLGTALNELAPGPGDAVTLTRYGSGGSPSENGSVLWIDRDGALQVEHALSAPGGFTVAPKTPAWDPTRGQLWLTTDLLARVPGGPPRRDAYRLDVSGRLLERIASEELHFAAVAPDGALYMAWVRGRELHLRIGGPEAPSRVLDRDFPVELDFVQDIQFGSDGRAVLTRWSGVAHVVERDGSFSTLALPRLDPEGLYYTGALRGERLCVTYCADVSVVCVDAPRKPPRSAL